MAPADPIAPIHPTDRLIGQAPVMQALRNQIHHLAPFDTVGNPFVPTLLLYGETGTGKSLVARVIHDSGPRAHGPFVEINCAAIPDTLLEVELFGFEPGTFTDARHAKPGLMESAAQGTLFLDEIDALPVLLQAKLLTVIEDKRVRRLGAVASRQIDVKVIAATPTALSTRVAEGRFRPDLYHRLAVVLLTIPPLRELGADILVLAQHFLRQYAAAHGVPPQQVSREAAAWLRDYDWPGNVRELSHLMERVTLFSQQGVLDATTLAQLCLPRPRPAVDAEMSVDASEEAALDEPARIRQALRQTGGNVLQAAHLLELQRGALRYRMRQYGITRPHWQTPSPPQGPHVQAASVSSATTLQQAATPAGGTVATTWEQKPVVVLALDVLWPAYTAAHLPRMDPWTWTHSWHQTFAEQVQGFGGHLVPSATTPLLAIFGLPHTLEQMPQRAVQAALTLRHHLTAPRVTDSAPPEVRIAIHGGQVLVDGQARDLHAHLLPLAETLSLPVRLLGQAAPGEIVLSSQIGRLVAGWFTLRERQAIDGTSSPDGDSVYAVVGQGPRRSPLEAYGKRPLSRFVGRERELATLHDLLAQAAQGRGQVVSLVGEPGVGKSRLCYECTQAQRSTPWRILESSPVAYGKDTPYLPVLDLLKGYFQLEAHDTPQTIHAKVRGTLDTLDGGLLSFLPAVLALLDVPVEDAQWLALDPAQRRQWTLEMCTQLFLQGSQDEPVLMVVENLHWIDTETQAFLDRLVDRLPTARVLLLVNYRPKYHHGWGSKAAYTQLRLDPLSSTQATDLLHGLLGAHPTLAPLLPRLVARTAGNPFFLEESVCTLVETGVLVGTPGAYHVPQALPAMPMPMTVHAVLATRIDRLPPDEKHLLHTAAVIGTPVPALLVHAIAELPDATVRAGLRQLQAAEFLYETHLASEHTYTFKHALTQEVAYTSLHPAQRQKLHAQIVEAMETLSPARLAEQVDRLAHHALQGEVWAKALAYSRQAGNKAMTQSAFREATLCFEQALAALRHLPTQRSTQEQAIEIYDDLGNALQALGAFERRLAYLQEALTLAEALGDPQRLGWICTHMTHSCWTRGDYENALTYGQRALALATGTGDALQQARANGFLGTIYFSLGDYRRARDVFVQALPFYEGEWRSARFGGMMIASVRDRLWLLRCCAELGTFAAGIAYGEEAAHIAATAGHRTGMVMAQDSLGLIAFCQGNLPLAIHLLEQALAQCRAADIPLFLSGIMATLSVAYVRSGQSPDALPLLDHVEVRNTTGGGNDRIRLHLGETYLLVGRVEEARHCAETLLAISRTRKERGNQAWALWLLGKIAAHHPPADIAQAEAHYHQALALAEALGIRPLQAHCQAALGTLDAQQDRRVQARTALSTALALYRAMDMPCWLPQTEAILVQVV